MKTYKIGSDMVEKLKALVLEEEMKVPKYRLLKPELYSHWKYKKRPDIKCKVIPMEDCIGIVQDPELVHVTEDRVGFGAYVVHSFYDWWEPDVDFKSDS